VPEAVFWVLGSVAWGGVRAPDPVSRALCSGFCVLDSVAVLALRLAKLDNGHMNGDRWRNPDTDAVVQQLLHVSDEEMASQQPLVRALVIQRLEAVFRACEPHMNGEVFPPDVRYVMLAEKVLKQMSQLYRLQEWSSAPRDLEVGSDERGRALESVDRGLRELEQKQGG
jgi:hypothetical protein